MSTRKLIANRSIYKQPKPAHLPDPPEGYGYVCTGVPMRPFLKDKAEVHLARFTPSGHDLEGYLEDRWAIECWFVGVINCCHYALPMNVWSRIEYPPDMKKDKLSH